MPYSDLEFWISTQGRVNRRPYFFAGVLAGVLIAAVHFIADQFLIVYIPIMLLSTYAAVALGIKRCHDRDKSGYFLLLNLIPFLNLWPAIELTFFKGTPGPNEYGPDPLE